MPQLERPMPCVRRLVVKIGSALVAPEGELQVERVRLLSEALAGAGERQVVVVTSGAVASGFRALGLKSRPRTIVQKQAAAAVGQTRLMSAWSACMGEHGRRVAQVLLTSDDLESRARFLNARRTLSELLARGVVPIINENDSVSFEEIKLGDNDRLSALVAGLLGADLLLILSTVPGLLASARAQSPVTRVESIDAARGMVRPEKSSTGVGGMMTKVEAAGMASSWGIPTVIAGGLETRVVERVLSGAGLGTLFPAAAGGRGGRGRKRWLESSARTRGTVFVDAGAAAALTRRGASLLPSGITRVQGAFAGGEPVEIRGSAGEVLGRGLCAYSSDELRTIAGKRSSQIGTILASAYSDEAIHRDDLVLVAKPRGAA